MALLRCNGSAGQRVCDWPAFCGGGSPYHDFWNFNLTGDTDEPDFSLCFQHTVLTWWPCGFLLVATPFYLASLSRDPTRHGWSQLSTLNRLKTVLCVGKVLTSLLILIWLALPGNQPWSSPADYVAAALKLLTYLLVTWLTPWEFRKGAHSSAIMFLFWLFMMACEILQLRSNILRVNHNPHSQDIVADRRYYNTYIAYFVFLAVQFALAFVPDPDARRRHHRLSSNLSERTPLLINEDEEEFEEDETAPGGPAPCAELSSPFWTRMTFWWFTPTVVRGYFWPYRFEDLPDLKPCDKIKHLYPGFRKELYGKQYHTSDWEPSKPRRSVLAALFRCVGYMNMLSLLVRMLTIATTVCGPVLLQLLMTWVQQRDILKDEGRPQDVHPWKAHFLAAMLFLSSFLSSILMHCFLHICYNAGLRMRTLLNAAVYRKLLRLSAAARMEVQNSITNLVATDAQRIQDCTGYMTLIWTVPILVVVVMALLWQELQEASLAGLAVLLIIIPLNSMYLSNVIRKLQVKQMDYKDDRIGFTEEIMKGIKILKLYAWEIPFHRKVLENRDKELDSIKKINYINAFGGMCWLLTPYLVSLAMFATYVYLPARDGKRPLLTANKAFVSQALINLLSFPLSMLPQGVSAAIQAWVSVQRIGAFMLMEELDDSAVTKDDTLGYTAIEIENGDFKWAKSEREVLRNISLTVPRGSLTAVVGSVGAGKTSLISAILGELHKSKGSVSINGSVAYVPQQAWIQLATLQDNILFGKPFNSTQYNNVVDACALRDDLKQLQNGDQTEIGERGINLSGGQKQRVSIARSVYQDEDIYLLDDPLSAVDAHVGKHIFDNVLGRTGLLHDKTRVLVTHGITFLPHVDHIVVLDGGVVTEQGSYDELLEQNGAFAGFIRTFLTEEGDSGAASDADSVEFDRLRMRLTPQLSREDLAGIRQMREVEMNEMPRHRDPWRTGCVSLPAHMPTAPLSALVSASVMSRRPRTRTCDPSMAVRSVYVGGKHSEVRRRRLRAMTSLPADPISPILVTDPEEPLSPDEAAGLVQEELAQQGTIRVDVYGKYIRAGGVCMLVLTVLAHVLLMTSQVWAQLWLDVNWLQNVTEEHPHREMLPRNVGVFGAFGVVQVIMALMEGFAVAYGCYAASRLFHEKLLSRIIHAPMAFFDTTPLGRILNRFTKDVDALDTNMPVLIRQWLFAVAPVVNSIIIIAIKQPMFLIALVIILIIFIVAQRFFISTVRQLKRIDNVKRSPLFNHFNESLAGVASIRAYRRQREFVARCDQLVDESQRAWFLIIVSQRWCGMTMETLGNFIVFFAAFLTSGDGNSSASAVGLAVSQALSITTYLNALIRNASDLETYVVSAERIEEYTHVDQEQPWDLPDYRPPKTWPQAGRIQFQNYSTRYRAGLDLVLKSMDCTIRPGEMVGIVGRTGAGKSSLSLALFRIIESVRGKILIDGINIAGMGLHSLRAKITVIPQDPVVFSGSLRRNLDPLDEYSDDDIWTALEHAHLKVFVEGLHQGLDYECGEGGAALCVGERQLLCLARALLRKTQILVLDEATSGVDLETDALVQQTIRTQFCGCTVLTVAHRLNTVMDYDRILVLDRGCIKEFDSPANLLRDPRSQFHDMAAKAGLIHPPGGAIQPQALRDRLQPLVETDQQQ